MSDATLAASLSPEELRAAALEAERVLGRHLPALSDYASRALGRRIPVVAGSSTYTTSSVITIRPPLALGSGAARRHEMSVCGVRDEHGTLLCVACGAIEHVIVGLRHEISHHLYDSFGRGFFTGFGTSSLSEVDVPAAVKPLVMVLEDVRIDRRSCADDPLGAGAHLADLGEIARETNLRIKNELALLSVGEAEEKIKNELASLVTLALLTVGVGADVADDFPPEVLAVLADPVVSSLVDDDFARSEVPRLAVALYERLCELGVFEGSQTGSAGEQSQSSEGDQGQPGSDGSEDCDQEGDQQDGQGAGGSGDSAGEPGDGEDGSREGEDSSGQGQPGAAEDEGAGEASEDGDESAGGSEGADSGAGSGSEDSGSDAGADSGGGSDGSDAGDGDGGGSGDQSDSGGGAAGGDDAAGDGGEGAGGVASDASHAEALSRYGTYSPEHLADAGGALGEADESGAGGRGATGLDGFDTTSAGADEREEARGEVVLKDVFDAVLSQSAELGGVSNAVREVNVYRYDRGDRGPLTAAGGYGTFHSAGDRVLGGLVGRARRVFSDNEAIKRTRGQRRGRVDSGLLGKRAWNPDDGRLFSSRVLPNAPDYSVLIGMDNSGSTMSGGIWRNLRTCVEAMGNVCHRVGVDFSLYAHTSGYTDRYAQVLQWSAGKNISMNMEVYQLKSFDESWTPAVRERVADLNVGDSNIDGSTLRFYRRQLEARRTERKVLLFFTDGEIPGIGGDGEAAIMREEVALCRRAGITLLGVGVKTRSPEEFGIPTVPFDSPSDLTGVLEFLGKEFGV